MTALELTQLDEKEANARAEAGAAELLDRHAPVSRVERAGCAYHDDTPSAFCRYCRTGTSGRRYGEEEDLP